MSTKTVSKFLVTGLIALSAVGAVASPAFAAKGSGRNGPEDRPHAEDPAGCTIEDGVNHC